jgi:hypothetical protein
MISGTVAVRQFSQAFNGVMAMSVEEQIQYHSSRAMRELDQGLVASCVAAARAHLQLSSMHLAKMRDLQGGTSVANPPMVMG